MNADAHAQGALLQLQALDSQIDRLKRERDQLPEARELDNVRSESARVQAQLGDLEARLGDLRRDLVRAEGEVDTVTTRLARDRNLIDSGSITSGKQLTDLQHEIDTLTRRLQEVEDAQLEVMEQVEEADLELAALRDTYTDLGGQEAALSARVKELSANLAVDIDDRSVAREPILAEIPDALITLYTSVRSQMPTAVATITGRSCGACQMELSPADIQEISVQLESGIARCTECNCILVLSA